MGIMDIVPGISQMTEARLALADQVWRDVWYHVNELMQKITFRSIEMEIMASIDEAIRKDEGNRFC